MRLLDVIRLIKFILGQIIKEVLESALRHQGVREFEVRSDRQVHMATLKCLPLLRVTLLFLNLMLVRFDTGLWVSVDYFALVIK